MDECLILDAANTGARQIHHLIPWEFLGIGKQGFDDAFNKVLFKSGWHPSNPAMNGFDIPELLRNGKKFHIGSHPIYNEKLGEALENAKSLTGQALLNEMNRITARCREELTNAYNSNKGIDEHFATITSL